MAKEVNPQASLFDKDDLNKWKEEWKDMPEFITDDITAFHQVLVSFENKDDIRKFAELLGQKIHTSTKSIWFPKVTEKMSFGNFIYTQKNKSK